MGVSGGRAFFFLSNCDLHTALHWKALCFLSHWWYQIQQAFDIIKCHRLFNLEFLHAFSIHTSFICGVTLRCPCHSLHLDLFACFSNAEMSLMIDTFSVLISATSLLIFIETKRGQCRIPPPHRLFQSKLKLSSPQTPVSHCFTVF